MTISINNINFKVKTVFTEKDTSEGMMGKKFKSNTDGMLFLMDSGLHCFWMKNCVIPLDIIFINNKKISKIHHNCPPCKTKNCGNYCGTGDMILEINGGVSKELGISVGDIITIR